MIKLILSLLICLFLTLNSQASADEISGFAHDKPGTWRFNYNIQTKTADEVQFKKNVTSLAEWFRQNFRLLGEPRGYDTKVLVSGFWDNHYRQSKANYGLRAEMTFYFLLFLKNGKVWTAELPSASYYSFNINSTHAAMNNHGTFPFYSNLNDDPKLESAINRAASKMDDIKMVFPFKQELAPGVHLYENTGSSGYNIIVFNPKRPAYWIPVTVKELANIYLEYYSLRPSDQILLQELKKEIARIPEEELVSPAFMGHDSNVVFTVNGRDQGLPLMRFNPDYWDRSLPPSAIQYMTFWYPQMSAPDMEAHLKRFGYPVRSQMLVNQINWSNVSKLIMKKSMSKETQ